MAPSDEPPEKRQTNGVYKGTNDMPRFGDPGRVLHLGLTDGEVANRVVVVGHHSRAELLASFLEPEKPGGSVFKLASDRGFLTFTGCFSGQRVSVISVGMGLAMMDFFVREARAVVEGPMAVVRFGTCGCLQEWVKVGTLSVATGSACVQRDFDHFERSDKRPGTVASKASPYRMSDVCLPDVDVSKAVTAALVEDLGVTQVAEGVNITADSFYSSQGRRDPNFDDGNEDLINEVLERYPKAITMEMETFQLLHLARSCVPAGSMRAAAAVVNVANRPTGEVVPEEGLKAAERNGGKALLKALARLSL